MKDPALTPTRLDRPALEARERAALAPYAAFASQTRGREHPEDEPPYRTAFQRDRDRIIHCGAFRRLQYKTQVFVNHEGDHYRTRLTHTMEVAQIARTIARTLALNEDLAEAVALAHDVGHPPFGHSGEDALNELMSAHGGFEHNSQALRVVEVLERPFPGFAGLNLTAEVRECLAKHRRRAAAQVRNAEFGIRNDGAGGLDHNVQPETANRKPAEGQFPLEGQVVDACDSIAYDHHDLEDGLAAELIRAEDLEAVELWRAAGEDVQRRYGPLPAARRTQRQVKAVIELMVSDVLGNTLRRIAEMNLRTIDDVRAAAQPAVRFSPALTGPAAELEQFLHARVYRHHRVIRMQEKAKRFLRAIFGVYVAGPQQLPPAVQERAAADGLHRAICDHTASMTDRSCLDEYRRLFEPFESV